MPRALGRVHTRVPGRHHGAAGAGGRQAPRHLSQWVPSPAATTAWMDQAWDDDAGLLWNPPGSFDDVLEPRSAHLVRETAWYALGLLRRDDPGDRMRAEAAMATVIGHQYDEPGQAWHGTFVRFPEWAPPTEGATEWIDYDPNWRQFLGSALAVAITDFDLSPGLASRARDAVHLAVEAEPSDRVPPSCEHRPAARVAGQVGGSSRRWLRPRHRRHVRRHGLLQRVRLAHLYGIDLLALGLWRRTDAGALRRDGAAVETALWNDLARWWHAGLGNLCGPYSRAYGMDLGSYVSGLSLALWCAGLHAPMPSLLAVSCPTVMTCAWLRCWSTSGCRCRRPCGPPSSASTMLALSVRSSRTRRPGWPPVGSRRHLAIGGEAGEWGFQARGQFHPATVHWRQLRRRRLAPCRPSRRPAPRPASAGSSSTATPTPPRGARPVRWVTNTTPVEVRGTPGGGCPG